jgi:MOSC domain-containing protein YiiM
VSAAGPAPLDDCDTPARLAGTRPRTGTVWAGIVQSIYIAPAAELPTRSVRTIEVVKGRGLEADRYFSETGTFSGRPGTGREVTLIESEALAAIRAEGVALDPGAHRRNLVTLGVPLNHLLGRDFRIGEVVLHGARLCEPCAHLARLTERRTLPALIHRGGLRADIVRGGAIRAGDEIAPCRS